jgi:hypothetical protein
MTTCSKLRRVKDGEETNRQAFSTLEPAPIMMKIAVVGAIGPTGIHLVTGLRKTVASTSVPQLERYRACRSDFTNPLCRRSQPLPIPVSIVSIGGRSDWHV